MTNQADTLIDSNFSWQAALSLALSSKLAYQRAAAVKSVTMNQWGYDDCTFLEKSDTQLFVAVKDDKVVISFRGSQGRGDWLNNFRAIGTNDLAVGRVHTGFYQAFQAIKESLIKLINDLGNGKKIWLTGHSLGGALATICLAELDASHHDKFQACYTYGQPRVGHSGIANFIKTNYGGRYFRFVNDDDIVTRIPPIYRHVGDLIHFAADGSLLTSPPIGDDMAVEADEAEMLETDTEPTTTEAPPLTEAEFEKFLATDGEEDSGDLNQDSTTEGFFPSVRDHDMQEYISKITAHDRISESRGDVETVSTDRQVERSMEMMAEVVESDSAAEMEGLEGIGFEPDSSSARIPILIKAAPGWTPPDDIKINSAIGDIHTALVTTGQLERLQQDTRNIISIDRSSDDLILDSLVSVPFVKAEQVHWPPLSEKGDQAIVGIIDTGIDVLHQAFTDINDPTKSRILYVWNQNDTSNAGHAPSDIDPNFSANYGRVYTQNEIEQFMSAGSVPHIRLRDPNGHGTHVSGIAAGRAVGTIGDGVAPQALLAVVIPRLQIEPEDPPSIGYSLTHLDGLLFLKEVAKKQGLPIAINISLGQNAGSHDGSSTLEAGFDSVLGQGREPGLVIVKSAGNERGHKGHAKVNVTTNLIETVSWRSKDKVRKQDYIEGWYDSFDDLEFALIGPNKKRSGAISFDRNAGPQDTPQKKMGKLAGSNYELSLTKNHRDNGNSLIQVIITPSEPGKKIRRGIWKLEILRRTPGSASGRVDFWIERTRARAINFEQGADDSMTLSVPGTARHVITVAACAPDGPPIRLTSSSSYGPTRQNEKKPEITAPGDNIFSARSNTNDPTAGVAETGTSMAAPHVTGAIALGMSKLHKDDPTRQFNAVRFKQALILNSMDASPNHHPGRGFGILDVKRFFDSL